MPCAPQGAVVSQDHFGNVVVADVVQNDCFVVVLRLTEETVVEQRSNALSNLLHSSFQVASLIACCIWIALISEKGKSAQYARKNWGDTYCSKLSAAFWNVLRERIAVTSCSSCFQTRELNANDCRFGPALG